MNLTHILIATTTAVSLVAAVGCSSSKPAPEETAVSTTVPPAEPVAAAPEAAAPDAMPSHPALAQTEPAPQATTPAEAPMTAAAPPVEAPAPIVETPKQEAPMTAAPAEQMTERAPRADRN